MVLQQIFLQEQSTQNGIISFVAREIIDVKLLFGLNFITFIIKTRKI